MARRILLTLTLLVICTGPGWASYTTQSDEESKAARHELIQEEWRKQERKARVEEVVGRCVVRVNKELVNPSKFDANVRGDIINYSGTQEARFKFNMCMVKSGYPLEPGLLRTAQ
jgi:hypothetical protein